MADKYWNKVAELTGLVHYPKEGPFGQKRGAVMGNRNGYILAIGPAKDAGEASIKVMVRFPKTADNPPIRAALANSAALAAALGTDKVADKHLKKATIVNDGIIWRWGYDVITKPKPEKVAALAIALVDTLKKTTVPDFQGKCEVCRSTAVSEILLKNNLPVYYCSGCQFKAQALVEDAARQYEATESNLFLGVIYGCAAAAAGALAWGGVALLINRIFLYGAVLIGYLIAAAVIKGMGRINLLGQVAIGVLTLASVMVGDAIYYLGYFMREAHVALSGVIVMRVVDAFWNIELKDGVVSMLFALFGAGCAVYYKARAPKFEVAFKPLGAKAKVVGAS